MKNYKIFIFFIAMFFLIVTIVRLEKESDDINENLSKIVKNYGLNESNARYDKESDTLEIDYNMNTWFYPKKPKEIYAWFESALYFNKKEGFIPKNITIKVDMGEAGWPTYYINGDDLLALCNQVNVDLLNYTKQDIENVAQMWIDTYFYYRGTIKNPEYREDYRNLLTPMNSSVISLDLENSYKSRFSVGDKGLVYDDRYFSSLNNEYIIFDVVDIEQFYFGQWDQNNNFWFYDRYNGLNVIEIELANNKENNIENKPYIILEANEIDISKMPKTFAKAYDIYGNKPDYKNLEVEIIYEADLSQDYEIDDIGEDIDIEKVVILAKDYLNRTEISKMAVEVLDYKSENIYIVRFFYDDINVVGGATCVAINKKTGEVLETYGEE